MAAAMLASSVNIPRCFHRISPVLIKVSRRKIHCSNLARSTCIVVGNNPVRTLGSCHNARPSLPLFSSGHRGFHCSPVFCDEFKVIQTPQFAESVTEGDVRWDKAVGDAVAMDEVVGEIETDKTSIPIHSPFAGVITELLAEDGATVVPGQDLVKINLSGDVPAAAPAKPAETPAPAAAAPPPPPSGASPGPIPTAPPPATPPPSQPMSSKPTAQVKVTPATEAGPVTTATRGEERVKMNRMRLRIAQRLKDAQNTCAMLTTFNEVDMSSLIDLRKQYKEAFLKKHGIKLGFMSAFIKASAFALTDQPTVNAVIDDSDIVYRDYVDVSVAVATPKGLVVPVLRDVQGMNYYQIERGLTALGEKARSGDLAIEDMDGGTFTISNGGVFGSLMGTPIINPPQSSILGMHGVFDRPVAINGKVEVRPMMYVALTYDHRLIDGREAVTFLRKIKSAVEDPRVLLLDL